MRLREIEPYQALAVVAVVLVILAPIAPTAFVAGSPNHNGPGNDVRGWEDALNWMNENTPAEGEFDGTGSELDLYGTYERQSDYDYSAGEYGVLSWWDYGHYITVLGERIPNANPFQQGATSAANFLISPNESQANDVVDRMSEDDAQTRYVVIDHKMVDPYSSHGGKFFAPTQFYNEGDVSESDYTRRVAISDGFSNIFRYQTQNYYDSTVVRLYHFHGSAVEPEPIVVDWDEQETQAGGVYPAVSTSEQNVREYDNMTAAREAAEEDETAIVGGFAGKPSERVPAMENYRLVGASERSATTSQTYNRGLIATAEATFGSNVIGFVTSRSDCTSDVTARAVSRAANGSQIRGHVCLSDGAAEYLQPSDPRHTKVFERVPGATIEGTGPENATLSAQVEMQMPGSNETFTYRQIAETDDDGSFTMTVPYSTTGYDEWGLDEGQTNVSVRATGNYEFQSLEQGDNGTIYLWSANASVSEGQVLGKDESPTTVEMERSTLFDPDEQNGDVNETAINESDAVDDELEPETNESSGNESDGSTTENESSDDGEGANASDDSASESFLAPVAE